MKKVAILLSLVALFTFSCGKSELETQQVPDVSVTPCKQGGLLKSSGHSDKSDKVDVEFTNKGVQITHYNFGVTCDFTTVNVTYTFVNGVLRITQQGCPNQADCVCHTDVSYTIEGISRNEVNVIFINGVQVYCYNDNIENKDCTIDLKIGETTENEAGKTACNARNGLSLQVVSVNDSRCPAVCVWAGIASVQFQLTTANGEYDFTLSKMGMQGGASCEGVVIEGLKYYLVDISPYPNTEERNPIKTVKVLVEKIEDISDDFFNATVIGIGGDCRTYLIQFDEDIEHIAGYSLFRAYYAPNLPEKYNVKGERISVKFRMPKNDEAMACTTMGPTFGQIYVLDVRYNQSSCDQNVIISADEYKNAPNHPVSIIDMKIEGNCLKIKFGTSGCSGNNWNVKLIDSGIIAESLPVQRTLKLSLNNREMCAAYFTKEMSFNIKDLQVRGNNSVQLNISGKSILYEY